MRLHEIANGIWVVVDSSRSFATRRESVLLRQDRLRNLRRERLWAERWTGRFGS